MQTFASSSPPSDYIGQWGCLLKMSEQAGALERDAWRSYQAVWKRTGRQQYANYSDYQQDLVQLMEQLANVKKTLSENAHKFYALSKITSQESSARRTGHPVFVPDKVLDEIDQIYIKHYHTEDSPRDGFNRLLCFTCHRCTHVVTGEDEAPICQTTLRNYIQEVKEYLTSHPDLEGVSDDSPQRAGVANAAIRLEPLHAPIGIPGVFTLPLASRSMLKDLWIYVTTTDQDIAFEVRSSSSFQRSYSIHTVCRFPDGSTGWAAMFSQRRVGKVVRGKREPTAI